MLTRRDFLKITGGSTIVWYAATEFGWVQRAVAAIPGRTLDPGSIDKFVTPLLIPPVMPRADVLTQRGGKPIDVYEISMKQFSQQILPDGMPPTTVWGYGAVRSADKRGLLVHNAPSLTIEAQWNRPARITWINDLVDAGGGFLPHLLPVDPTLHWANPPGGADGRDMRPTSTRRPARTPDRCRSSRTSTAPPGSATRATGTPRRGSFPPRTTSPTATRPRAPGTTSSRTRPVRSSASTWGPGFATFQYPNDQRASTIWYHDHALGMTRLNVYAGPAGFFLVRGGPEGDKAVLDTRSGTSAVFPGPAPKEGDKFPSNKTYREIPIAIQDRSFNVDGSSSIRTRAPSSTASGGRTSPRRTSRRSGTRSSSGTRSW